MSDTYHLLIVDDQPFNLSLIKRALQRSEGNYRFSTARNGFEALELAAGDPPDLVILDIMMPKLDGFEACRRLKAAPQTAEIPVILLTALTDTQSRIQGIKAGADDFISKPFNRHELVARVSSLLQLHDARRRLRKEHDQLKAILDNTGDAIIVSSADGGPSLLNPAARRLLGLTDADVYDRPWKELLRDGSLLSFFAKADRMKAPRSLEVTTDEDRVLHANVAPLGATGAVIVLHDITLSKEMDRKRLMAEQTEKQRLRETFQRYISPDLFERVMQQEHGLLEQRERLQVVVMFADLRGFTRLTSQLAPDTVVHILNAFFIEMSRVVHSTQGTVFNLIGDEMMIGYGVPFAQPDDADRALQTAVAMHRRFNELSQNWRDTHKIVVGLGIGISRGSVVVGNVGSPSHMQYTMVGDAVNMAHRLVDLAARQEIILTQEVLDAQSSPVETLPIERLPPTTVKGKEGLHVFYRIVV